MYALANALDPEDLRVDRYARFREMLCAGFTSVGEFHYLHHARDGSRTLDMALALRAAARRCWHPHDVAARCCTSAVDSIARRLRSSVASSYESLEEFGRLLEQLRGEPCGVAPHSLRAVAPETLPALVALADELLGPRAPIHIHVSEQIREVNECRAAYGRPPIRCLDDSVTLDERWSLVHATHAEPAEVELIHTRRANLVLCPLTEAYLGDGLVRAAGIRGARRHVRGRFGQQRAHRCDRGAALGRIRSTPRDAQAQRAERHTGPRLAAVAGSGGDRRALDRPTGRRIVAPDAFADLVVLDLEIRCSPGIAPENLLDAWLTAGSGGADRFGLRRRRASRRARGAGTRARCRATLEH